MEVGVQDDFAFVSELTIKRKRALQLAHQLHVTRIRVNLFWVAIVNKGHSKKRPKHTSGGQNPQRKNKHH